MDFSTGRDSFVEGVGAIEATGGDDAAEDVFSGLEAAAALEWQSFNRVLVHIADMPCHGSQFHDLKASDFSGSHDSFPAGDKCNRNVADLLLQLQQGCRINSLLFCHLAEYTHKMVRVFKELAGEQCCAALLTHGTLRQQVCIATALLAHQICRGSETCTALCKPVSIERRSARIIPELALRVTSCTDIACRHLCRSAESHMDSGARTCPADQHT